MKLKPLFASLFVALFFNSDAQLMAQAPDWQWAKSFGESPLLFQDFGLSVTVDVSGNVYTTGYFNGTVDFDPGPGIFNLISAGGSDCFVSKLDSSGNFIWAKALGGSTNDLATEIALDPLGSGEIYITGNFTGVADFDPDTGVSSLTAAGGFDIFLCKLSGLGELIWLKSMGGTLSEYVSTLGLDASGNIFTAGYFGGTCDFDPGVGIVNLTSAGYNDIFVAKLNTFGNLEWAKCMGGSGQDQCNSISLDNAGNVYTIGEFQGASDFDPGAGTSNLISAGDHDIFICKLDPSGNYVWAKRIGGTGFDYGSSAALDLSGNNDIYCTGFFSDTVDFNPGTGIFQLIAAGPGNVFVCKLTNTGNFVWAKTMEGDGGTWGDFIVVNPIGNGEVYLLGDFADTTDFDWGNGVLNIAPAGDADIFISKFDASGNFEWVKTAGGASDEIGLSMAVDQSGKLVLTGAFSSPSISFDFFTLTNADTTGITMDLFIAKLDNISTGVESLGIASFISLFPNPAVDEFTIESGRYRIRKIELYDLPGRKIDEKIVSATSTEVRMYVSQWAAGIYFVKVYTDAGMVTAKLVKE